MPHSTTYKFYRNATAKLNYAGTTFLLDPMLSDKGALPSFAGVAANPTVDLPASIDDIISGVNALIVSHLHGDHFDGAAAKILDKGLPVFTPRNGAPNAKTKPDALTSFADSLRGFGFENVTEIASDASDKIEFTGVTIQQVFARHGKGELGRMMGGANGLIFTAKDHPTIYWAGDTILDEEGEVASILNRFAPDLIIAHTGGPVIEALSPNLLLMDAAEAAEFIDIAHAANPQTEVIAIHMEALDHCFSTRSDLEKALANMPKEKRNLVHIPDDGQTLVFPVGA